MGRTTPFALGLALAFAAAVGQPPEAAAQSRGIFADIFGWLGGARDDRFAPTAAYSDPSPPSARQPDLQAPLSLSPGGTAYCVRLCDGRYFPLSPPAVESSAGPAKVCAAMCPAAKTAIFRGGEIDTAMGMRGERYADLDNAFVYRQRLVANCTCNGRDAFGLAPIDIATDPTLRPGDMVATKSGVQVFRGFAGPRATAAFSPVRSLPNFEARHAPAITQVSRTE
jgi:hypothetical protein